MIASRIPKPDRGAYLPSSEHIRRECEKIQAGWSEADRRLRGEPDRAWIVPLVQFHVEEMELQNENQCLTIF